MPCERLHENIEALIVGHPRQKNKNFRKATRALLSRPASPAQNANGAGRQNGRPALSDQGEDTGNAPRQ
jgi:hypothetical protein